MIFNLLFVLLFSPKPWAAEVKSLHLNFETAVFRPEGVKVKVEIKGTASSSLRIFLKEIEVRTSVKALEDLSSRIETSLGVKTSGTRLLVPMEDKGNFSFSAALPKSLIKMSFEIEYENGEPLGTQTLSFGVMDVHKSLNLNVRRQFEYALAEELLRPPTYLKSGFWIWTGAGYSYTNYKQTVETAGSFDDNDTSGPSLLAEVGYKNENGFGGLVSYKKTSGEVMLDDTNILGVEYTWTTISAEGLLEKRAKSSFAGGELYYGALVGVQDHRFPYFHQADIGELQLKEVSLRTASAGFVTRLQRGPLGFHWAMRYQYPISTEAGGLNDFDISTRFAFDGSVGITYYLGERWKLGWFWYGQWHEYDLGFKINETAFTGSQTLFYSNMDLRLGVEF